MGNACLRPKNYEPWDAFVPKVRRTCIPLEDEEDKLDATVAAGASQKITPLEEAPTETPDILYDQGILNMKALADCLPLEKEEEPTTVSEKDVDRRSASEIMEAKLEMFTVPDLKGMYDVLFSQGTLDIEDAMDHAQAHDRKHPKKADYVELIARTLSDKRNCFLIRNDGLRQLGGLMGIKVSGNKDKRVNMLLNGFSMLPEKERKIHIIYVLVPNPDQPNVLKIGRTTETKKKRLQAAGRDAGGTGSPSMLLWMRVSNAIKAEKEILGYLDAQRVPHTSGKKSERVAGIERDAVIAKVTEVANKYAMN